MALKPKPPIPPSQDILKIRVQQICEEQNVKKNDGILKKLLNQFIPIDFMKKSNEEYEKFMAEFEKSSNPDDEEKPLIRNEVKEFKLQDKHYCIGVIDEIQRVAIENKWDLVRFNEAIFLFNGEFWQTVELNAFQIFLSDVAGVLGVPHITHRYHLFRENLYKQFIATQLFAEPVYNNNAVYINLLDCTLEVTDGSIKTIPFDKELFLTYQLPYKYDANATYPIFKKFLNEVLPDESAQEVLAEYLGYLFIRNGNQSFKAEKILVFYGSGANGKSVVFEITLALLGRENVSNFSLESLTDATGYYRAKIGNPLVNYGSEIGSKTEADMLKKIASGEPIEARHPYGRPFLLYNYAKLIFNCNQLPKDTEQTDAYFRRFLIIPFNVTIEEDKQDKLLASKIVESELPGILNWALEGLKRLLAQGKFTKCKLSDDILIRYKIESDSVQMYLEELNITKSVNNEKYYPFKVVYASYRQFCTENGYRPLNSLNFSKRMISLKFQIERKNIGKVIYISTPLENVF